MSRFSPLEGVVTAISRMQTTVNEQSGCTLLLSILGQGRETFHVVLAPDTYVLNQEPLRRGDVVIAFYDTLAPMPLIYPPQYRAVAIVKTRVGQYAALDYFNQLLFNSDDTLRLTPTSSTDIRLQNGQRFLGTLGNQYLLVLYSATTRSIPAQTTPSEIVVFCTA